MNEVEMLLDELNIISETGRAFQVKPSRRSFSIPVESRRLIHEECKGDSTDLVAQLGNPITRNNFRLLYCDSWLNDEIINGYMDLINRRDLILSESRSCYAFNSFFFEVFSKSGYRRVAKWTTQANVDIFSLDKLLFPLNQNYHWVLAAVNFVKKRFELYDSLGAAFDLSVLSLLEIWLKQESLDKRKIDYSTEDWTRVQIECPRQKNAIDCGVFVCQFAERLSVDQEFDFQQSDIPAIRQMMAMEILETRL